MKKRLSILLLILVNVPFVSFQKASEREENFLYDSRIEKLLNAFSDIRTYIHTNNIDSEMQRFTLLNKVKAARLHLKACDFWIRYLEPTAYKKINAPLPVEWETEVHEKFEVPYLRVGGGLTLAEIYLRQKNFTKDSLLFFVNLGIEGVQVYRQDSILHQLKDASTFFFCNRLYLLNLASIYTTGFECPNDAQIIVELRYMMKSVLEIYIQHNKDQTKFPIQNEYLQLYNDALEYVQNQPDNFSEFDHFYFIQNYINPLFKLNQKMIVGYKFYSNRLVDYTLNYDATSIFDKNLFFAQTGKGVFSRISDKLILSEIDSVGKLLFYDPILSGNAKRSCASCHKPAQFFTDTTIRTALNFDPKKRLTRNTPSLINSTYHHLLHLDGSVLDLQQQAQKVMTNQNEMSSSTDDIVKKVSGCPDYKNKFQKWTKLTPAYPKISIEHIISAVTVYYSKFSEHYSAFDEAMEQKKQPSKKVIQGFNLFMTKAKCGTCHFLPSFAGIKPPFTGNEFEVIGTPHDSTLQALSSDLGRFIPFNSPETKNAFRTNTIRNVAKTPPYMHNGALKSLNQVIDFYNMGGGAGHGYTVPNQTLPSDSLHLSVYEKDCLIAFINALTENIRYDTPPKSLPQSKDKNVNSRKVGGQY